MWRFKVEARRGVTVAEHDGQPPGKEQVEVAARQSNGAYLAGREPLRVLLSEERIEPTLLRGGDGRTLANARLALGEGGEGDSGHDGRGEQHDNEREQRPAPSVPSGPPAEACGDTDG